MLSVTVAIPMYNAAPHLRECLDSVLAQTFRDFELLIVDDGSTDGCVDIVRSYADPRIRLLLNRHDYIGSLNLLLSEARGKYIARMDADDVMVPQRLALQFAYMEAHPDVDLLGGNMVTLGTSDCLYDTSGPCRRVTLQDMLAGCCLVHPTVMFRTATVRAHGLAYEADYIYAEDYRLWMRMLQLDLQLRNLPDVLVRYRFSDGQISHRHADRQAATSQRIRREMRAWQARTEAEVAAEEIAFPPSGNELTLVIPFINEGEEVARTVRSARQYVGDAVDILVVNDHSYDGYDYEADLAGLNVRYVYNRINIGAAASKEKGARLCTTPYFILLDAHMRFYDAAWLTRYLEVLKTDDRRIVCCQTRWLSKKDGVVAEGNKADTRGAFLRFENVDVLPGIHWGHFRLRGMAPHQVPAVMGATYGASKRYWNRIRGLQGLIHYGCEEAYMCIKAWLEGGECCFLEDVAIGHIYREAAPYPHRSAESFYNNVFIMRCLFPTSLRTYGLEKFRHHYPALYDEIQELLAVRRAQWEPLCEAYRQICRSDFAQILAMSDVWLPEHIEETQADARLLPTITAFLDGVDDMSVGLQSGRMARVVYYCLYAAFMGQPQYDDEASCLFAEVCAQLPATWDVSFADGLSGVGWAIVYLHSHGFLDEVEDLLCTIDTRLMARDPRRFADFSLLSGLGGVLAYVVARLGHCHRTGRPHAFDERYLYELEAQARRLLVRERDYRCRSYARQLLARHQPDWCILRPEWWEVFSFPAVLNENRMGWQPSMDSCVGFGLRALGEVNKVHRLLMNPEKQLI